MSYPPGRPLQVPQMPPNLQPRPPTFGTFPRMPGQPVGPMRMMTVGMMQGRPMHPGMMPTMPPRPAMTQVTASSTIAMDQKSSLQPKLKITVFVGNISEKAPDGMIKQLLQKCGPVLNWKRVQGASGKLQAFGFCEYADPEAGLRAMRVLHDLKLAEKKLVVKVDAKTRTLLDEYLADKKKSESKEDGEAEEEEGLIDDEGLDDHAKKVDRAIQEQINLILQDHQAALNSGSDKDSSTWGPRSSKVVCTQLYSTMVGGEECKFLEKAPHILGMGTESVDDMELEEDKKNLIFREIDRFRDTYKADRDKEENKDKEKERRERKERERERERQREKDRERERERDREREKKDKERKRERDRELEREREREVRGRSRDERDLRRERERERERERDREKERDYDEEEEYERRKFERKLREKEEAYQERVKNWESRERKKKRENEKLKELHADERIEQEKEAKRLKEFLEDYDDERDDPKYYRASALERRRKEREKEMDLDIKDRKREKEEIEDIKRKLLEEGREDVDEEIERLEKDRDAHKEKQLHMVLMSPTTTADESKQDRVRMKPAFAPVQSADNGDSATPESASPLKMEQDTTSSGDEESEPAPTRTQSKIGFGGLKLVGASSPTQSKKNKKMSLVEVFNQDDEDGSEVSRKRRKLIPIEYTEEEKQAVEMTKNVLTAEDKKKVIKTIIDKIPTSKEELFAYKVDWVIVDESLMERRIKPWINKKIVEYIGEEEPTLTEFICTKLLAHSPASSILQDITMVLDEEAEVFVVKMWRVLIYEVEAKKQGLVK
ncbi:RNA-binding protein 25-like [Anneissia japonica]|uniref:RNA-binding protein 25-like n=1 Tax=Anneissia japonica TaxID=1529436 RepID=UPI0014259F24|nr:RNA-binding protein 25-like [Anneissia japonica]